LVAWRGLAVGLVAALSLTLAACGDDTSEEDGVTEAIAELQQAMAAGRPAAVCDRLAERPRRQIGSIGHGRKPTTCVRDLREMVFNDDRATAAYGGDPLSSGPRPKILEVEVAGDGRVAVATMTLGSGPFEVELVKQDGVWKLADFFGAQAPAVKELR
jgi:hypothetical protein